MTQKLSNISEIQVERGRFKPVLPNVLRNGPIAARPIKGKLTQSVANQNEIKDLFKNTYGRPVITFKKGNNPAVGKKVVRVAVFLSGGPAPGGHNVIAGLFDGLKKANKKNSLIGYLGGPSGILGNTYKKISEKTLNEYRNTGGFDYLQSGRTKIETLEQLRLAKDNLEISKVDALVVVGGDDSNTNAAMMAEYLEKENVNKCVIGIPKTIDGDLKNKYVETSFGFDTATKTYSELVGNICRDANSTRKYWHFVRLMGRSASHITLEVAFKTHPNIVLIGEEILAGKMTLAEVVENIVNVIVKRSQAGKDFGVVLVPEGIIEFIPEMKELITSLNDVLFENVELISNFFSQEEKREFIYKKLSQKLFVLMSTLPASISYQLISDRDPHGNIAVSLIETEKLLIEMVCDRLTKLNEKEKYKCKFSAVTHFFGYEGRCGIPSNFDANYTYALGYNAALLALNGFTGYMSYVKNLIKPPKKWECGGIPLTMMMDMEKRSGKKKPVIRKTLIDLHGEAFKEFLIKRNEWAISENYISPGPIQYFGLPSVTDITTKTLQYEFSKKK
jgi:pyrophosphate--fructose-6-phosphate 1-phosphotransferase